MSNILIKDLEFQFISSKVNNYDTMMTYLKICDTDIDNKLKSVFNLSDSVFKPVWKTDDDTYLMKVKATNIEKTKFVKGLKYRGDVDLVSYYEPLNKKVIKGYSAKLANISQSKIVDETFDDDN